MDLKKQNLKIARKFLGELRKKIKNVEVILFGSRAEGKEENYSDMDLCVIVDKLDKKTESVILDTAWKIGFEENIVIVPIIFTKKEWLNSPLTQSLIYKEINKKGVKV